MNPVCSACGRVLPIMEAQVFDDGGGHRCASCRDQRRAVVLVFPLRPVPVCASCGVNPVCADGEACPPCGRRCRARAMVARIEMETREAVDRYRDRKSL